MSTKLKKDLVKTHYNLRPLSLAITMVLTGQTLTTQVFANEDIEVIEVKVAQLSSQNPTRIPLTVKELPQSVSSISREMMDLSGITDINDVMLSVTGVNVTLYDSQRPLYFARGFQITDFQVDGIPTFSGSTNQEYDTSLYQQVEVVRGANEPVE
ncbi:MAG: TonB-dependent receptor plug domain-containing protein [Pseudoalteromonas prydzensis]|uniref:TonB-dependent receptor plug domain-containing protein n=1 Tax=Pseudoalteromonas prydzensis TaxID=182141 RepID=UPI003F95B6AC